MKYGWNKSIKENSLRPWVLIPEDNRHSTVTRKIPLGLFSVEPVTISYTHYWVHFFTCKNCFDWDIFHYFYDIEHYHFFSCFLPNLELNIGKKKYLKTAKIIDESLILAIVLRNYSTKLCYIFQLKRELKVWKYIFNLFHFEMLIQNRNPKFRPLCLVFSWIINCPCLSFLFFLCQVVLCIIIPPLAEWWVYWNTLVRSSVPKPCVRN